MLTFWLIVTGFILVALAFVVPPLWRTPPKKEGVDTQSMNVAIYKERLAELQADSLTDEQRLQAQRELDKSLLHDLQETAPVTAVARARWASVLVAILIPLFAMGTYWRLGTPELVVKKTIPAKQQEIRGLLNKLIAHVQQNPTDSQGWFMLARAHSLLEEYPQAVKAYEKTVALVGEENPQLLSEYAETLGTVHGGNLEGRPAQLLDKALQLDANHQKSLWLAGLAAMQIHDYANALTHWRRLLSLLPATDPEGKRLLQEQISQLEPLIADTTPTSVVSDATATPTTTVAEITKITVQVSLDAALKAQVNDNDTVFVYARAIQGTPMPLAIVRLTASQLPTVITLDDSMAMMPELKLSHFSEVRILGRLTKTGAAMPQSGDLQGQTIAPVPAQGPVTVVINERVP